MVFPPTHSTLDIIKKAQNFYVGIAKDVIKNRVEYFADLMQINYKKIVIMNNKRRWGACTLDGVIKFNYRLILLPHKCIDYVIIHELCHFKVMNHSSEFWREVEKYYPYHKLARRMLRESQND